MGISELRQMPAHPRTRKDKGGAVGAHLVKAGIISQSDLTLAQQVRAHCDASLDRVLLAEGLTEADTLLQAHAARLKTRCVMPPEMAALDSRQTGEMPGMLLKRGVLPVTDRDGLDAVVTSTPGQELAGQGERMLVAHRDAVQAEIALRHRDTLRQAAQERVPESESCRTWGRRPRLRLVATLVALMAVLTVTAVFPTMVFAAIALWASFTLVVSIGMKLAAFVARLAAGDAALPAPTIPPAPEALPKVSVLVPLFRETEIAHHLIARLTQLTYPKCLLDIILVLEEEDELTRQTLAQIDLPPWIRAVVVPDGQPRTKPRAMNYALDFCEGDIIGIFDAEDAPEPDQITAVARRFQHAPREVACLQGVLDYYNPRQNWLARCFTIEYATWFRTLLPGMAELGFAIPLGGTTVYFRRDILEEVGGWDAHNVTEDADLGFRLARHGYRTEMIGTVTGEEANCRLWPWIKQRSRWLKGYMTTYLVHMRRPLQLYRQLGAWKFWGFQTHFVTALSQFFLAPVLWSFWLVLFGLSHPLDPLVPRDLLVVMGSLFLAMEVVNIIIYAVSVSVAGPRHKHLLWWVPTMHFYGPLGAFAAYKALYELVLKPFFWDKTAHGLFLAPVPIRQDGSDDTFHLT